MKHQEDKNPEYIVLIIAILSTLLISLTYIIFGKIKLALSIAIITLCLVSLNENS
jgi:hypothetical protein